MRVITHGELYEVGETTCPNCKCVFAYNKTDISIIYDKKDECDIDIVICPECH